MSGIEAQQEAAVQSFTQLAYLENRLQSEFQTVLEEDEGLSTLADGSAEVHTTIEERREALGALSETNGELRGQHEEITQIDSGEISEEALDGVLGSLEAVAGSLDEFTSAYEVQLSSETAYFESLAQEDATYETFRGASKRSTTKWKTSRRCVFNLMRSLWRWKRPAAPCLHSWRKNPMNKMTPKEARYV